MNILTMGIELSAVVHRWRAQLEGSFALLDENNHDVSPRGRKARAIIVYLIAHQDVRIPRERLMALLWGDRGEIQARTSLRQALTEIRRASGELISSDRDHAWIDSEVLVDPPTSSSGEFAEDLSHITPEFDDWLMSERHRRTSEDWNKLHGEVEELLATGRGAEAMPLIDRMQLIDPYNEDWLRSAMRAEAQAGHPAAIKKVYREMAARLQLELGVAPAKATRALHDELLSELIGPTSPDLRADAVLDDQREVQASEDRVDTSERKLGSAMPRRLVVGGALVGVTAAIVGTPLWLGSGESSLSPTAMEYYRRGIELRGQASLSQAEQSVAYLREATRIDPEFGEAWGALAWGYRSLLEYGPRPNAGQTAMLARKAASRALEIHPGDTQALAALLLLKPIYGNWAEIEAGCRRLLKGDAAHSLVQFNLALTLCEVGRWRDALTIFCVISSL
jgi:DNA-binding SARP family transcriptional activator